MIARLSFILAGSFCASLAADDAPFQNDFQKDEPGKSVPGFQVVAGDFKAAAEGEQRFLELPGAPLDTFSVLFGPALPEAAASARFFGTKSGRKFPTFALGLNGGGGFRLQVSPAKGALEIIRGDLSKTAVPFEWRSGAWTFLKIQVRKSGEKWSVEGKAWQEGSAEPGEWTIRFEDTSAPPSGRASLWGSPFSGTPIRFDDLSVQAQAH